MYSVHAQVENLIDRCNCIFCFFLFLWAGKPNALYATMQLYHSIYSIDMQSFYQSINHELSLILHNGHLKMFFYSRRRLSL